MSDAVRTAVIMDTLVTIHIVGRDDRIDDRMQAIDRAFDWFYRVERCCSRFDADSEVTALARHIGEPIPVSTMLFEAVQFALALAEESGGAFDPTVGPAMERRGFNREYRTGRIVNTAVEPADSVSYRDLHLDATETTIALAKPLMIDLGAVAKGLAIDMAARELASFESYAIDAGGDLYLAGANSEGHPWSIGIRDPRQPDTLVETLHVSDRAVCTSGNYERRSVRDGKGHILDPRSGTPAVAALSVTVVAPHAMLADALATAAFVLGPTEGIQLLNRHGVGGLIVSPDLERHVTELGLQ